MKKLLIITYSIIALGILCLGMLSILMNQNEEALAEKQEQRYQSYLLADQLRQSSDDLTRMARTYVISGNAQYEKQYWDILAIRNGEKPRPQHYDRIYWDLVLKETDKPRPDGEAIPLQKLMKKLGFSEQEFAKLREAQANSDGLVLTETIAMNAVKGLYDDGTGHYVKQGEPDFEMARRIMYDAQYHEDKAAIMKPIDAFFQLLDERTQAEVEYHVNQAHFLLFITQIMVFCLAVLSVGIGFFVTRSILKQVGGEPAKIAQMAEQLANGKLDIQFELSGKTTGIYASVQVMVNRLKTVIEDLVQVSQGLAEGQLSVTPQSEYPGDLAQIKKALKTALSQQQSVIEDIVQVSQGLAAGELSVKPQSEYPGDFLQIKQALETALSNQQLVIQDIVRVSQGLAAGNLNVKPAQKYQGDFLQIKNAQETALSNQRFVIEDIVQVSQGLAAGDLQISSQAHYQGDFIQIKQALETALSNLQKVLEDIVQVSQGLAEGDQQVTPLADYQGQFVQIKQALIMAAMKLAEETIQNSEQNWLKTGQTQLNDQLRGEQDVKRLAKKTIDFLTTYIGAEVGLFYLVYESEPKSAYLKEIASYAYTRHDNPPNQFRFGEGLVGQAALEKKMICCTHRPDESVHITRSGLSQALPREIVIFPFLYNDTVKGVIEIGCAEALTDIQNLFIEQAMQNIGIAVNLAESHTQMQALLDQSQRQTEELQTQSEELQAQQEEMQQINEQLQTQQADLQHKQEGLQQQNEELQSQSEELQSQSEELQTQQEELKQTNDELEERTKDLEQQKEDIEHKNIALKQNQAEMEKARAAIEFKAKELELASQYKSEFLANMSHELRTPLNSLLILAQLLANNKPGNLNEKQVSYAQTIQSAGSDLLTLINDILDLSKVEAGKMEVNIEALSLSDLLEMLEQKFSPLASEKGLVFEKRLADDLPPFLQTDGQRLKQILNNLLSNAFKFTSQGKIRLDIQRVTHSGEDKTLLGQMGNRHDLIAISVIDTGIGIPKDKQQLIFEAFQQVDGTTSRRYGGTGLGLSISRQLVRLLGGEITLHSEEGSGTTFTLSLPETLSVLATMPSNEIPDTASTSAPPSDEELEEHSSVELPPQTDIDDDRASLTSEDKSLLVIEDDPKFSRILIELGREKDFKCLLAEDGRMG
ncbi:MAG: ATP-binding protein, partial [Candidatus Parabeggiatoa sp.]|nr:ATP-binding protein [Candidatus Parabeggiatoa sp.]